MIRQQNNIEVSKVRWSHPMGLKELSHIFEIHRNTMSKWLKNQTVCNRQLSPRKWEIAMYELPYDLINDNIENDFQTLNDSYL